MAKRNPTLVLQIKAEGGDQTKAVIRDVNSELAKGGDAARKAAGGANELNKAVERLDGKQAVEVAKSVEKIEAAAVAAQKQLSATKREINDTLKGASNSFTGAATDMFGGDALKSVFAAKGALSGGNPFTGFLGGISDFQGQIAETVEALKQLGESKAEATVDAGGAAGEGAPDAAELKDSLSAAADKAQELSDRAEGIRNVGLAVAGAGAAGIALSESFREAYEEGQGMEQRLESILKQQGRFGDLDTLNEGIGSVTERGHFDDDDSLRDATIKLLSFNTATKDTNQLLEMSARQARTMGMEVGQVAEQLGKAYNTGQVSMLKKSGVTVSDDDIERIKEAYALSQELGQQKFMEVIGPAITKNTVALEDSLTGTKAAANDAARAMDDFQTNVGEGAASANQHIQILKGSILSIPNASPELEKTAGYVFTIGSYAVAGIGSIVAFGAQIAQLVIAWNLHTAAQAASAAAADTSTVAQGTNAAATTAAGAAATGDAAAQDTLAASQAAAAATADAQAVSTTAAATATRAAGVAALGTAVSFAAIGTALVAVGVGLGTLVTEGLRRIGVIDQEVSALDRLSNAWARIKQAAGGENASWNQNQADMGTEIAKVKAANAKAVLDGSKTQEEADKNNLSEEIRIRTEFARTAMREGDAEHLVENQEAAARLQQQQQAQESVAQTLASTSSASPVVAAGIVPGVGLPIGAASGASSAPGAADAIQAQIDGLQSQLRAAKGKKNAALRAQLQDQLAALRIQMRGAKDSDRETAKAQKLAEKEQRQDEKDAIMLKKLDADIAADEKIDALQEQLDKAKENADAAKVRSITLQIEQLEARKDFDEAMIEAGGADDAGHRQALESAARKRFDAAGRRAERTADKAAHAIEKGEGSKKKGLTPAEALALMAASGARGGSSLFGNTFLQGIGNGAMSAGRGDNFGGRGGGAVTAAEMSGYSPIDWGASNAPAAAFVAQHQAFVAGVPSVSGQPDQVATNRGGKLPSRTLSEQYNQRANGSYLGRIEVEVEIPYQGIGDLL